MTTIRYESTDRHAFGAWLGRFPWDHFVTLTYAKECMTGHYRSHIGGWLRRLEQIAQGHVPYFWCLESGAGGRRHLHAFVGGTAGTDARILARAWKAGGAEVRPYRATPGSGAYLTKQISRPDADYDMSDVRYMARAWPGLFRASGH